MDNDLEFGGSKKFGKSICEDSVSNENSKIRKMLSNVKLYCRHVHLRSTKNSVQHISFWDLHLFSIFNCMKMIMLR